MAGTRNTMNTENFIDFDNALPTKLVDINGELITEFASDEKRELTEYNALPQHLIDALISREDRIFFKHRGFSIKATVRAVIGQLLGQNLGGGSTLTQQTAGLIYCNRTEKTVKRKLKELWWAIQMERRFSKQEILEKYMNIVYLGGGTSGVEAASKYYFGHSAQRITPAESAILVIQLSSPARYNPFDHPNVAMSRQQYVLEAMVKEGYITQAQASDSFDRYWADFDYTRTSTPAYFRRDDMAPWFSEYVRRELGSMIYGSEDIYTGGFTVNTTLNLAHQKAAEEIMARYIERANSLYQKVMNSQNRGVYRTYIPMAEALALLFNLSGIKVSQQRSQGLALAEYNNRINPIIDVMSLMTGIDSLKIGVVNRSTEMSKSRLSQTTIEGTMVALENSTGYITALVGGSKYDSENQFIRAVQARVQPGSTFKPLYYSAAIDSGKYTATTPISDTPVVFYTQDGKPYIPQNFRGEWKGNVQLWYALAHSMNVPSLKILDGIGFDAAIKRAVALLGISEEELPSRAFVPGYPIGLGVCSVRPIEIARAFAIFANGGREVTPMAVRSIEDRNGNVIMTPERDIRQALQAKGAAAQVISPQTAYIMTQLLEQTVRSGTLASGASLYSRDWRLSGSKFETTGPDGKKFIMPAAGKTGTTQNWADAWAVGFTPYYTSVFWFGFDRPGQSLGLDITGSTLAGPAWGDFMEVTNQGLSYKNFSRPANGLVQATACSVSGQIPTEACGSHRVTAWYLSGTQPAETCALHANNVMETIAVSRLEQEQISSGYMVSIDDDTPLQLNLDFLDGTFGEEETGTDMAQEEPEEPYGNFLLD